MRGIDAADRAGLKIKINTVALRGVNEDEIDDALALEPRQRLRPDPDRDHADGRDRQRPDGAISAAVSLVRARLHERFTLDDIPYRSGGPAAMSSVRETGGRLGFITPLTHNFCEACNRVRVTCTGTLYMCLGQEDAADLRAPLRASEADHLLNAAIDAAIAAKPKGHDFVIEREGKPSVSRTMSTTGG